MTFSATFIVQTNVNARNYCEVVSRVLRHHLIIIIAIIIIIEFIYTVVTSDALAAGRISK